MKTLQSLVGAIFCLIFLTSCAAVPMGALMVAQYIPSAYVATKLVQEGTSGNTEILIGENQVKGTDFSKMSHLAIWPDNQCEVYLAQNLQDSEYFERVVPPGKVLPFLEDARTKPNLTMMTKGEKAEAFRLVAEKTGTQWVVATETRGSEFQRGFISRSTATVKANLLVYSLAENRVVYFSSANLKIHLGGNIPNTDTILKDSAVFMAQKIIELRTSGASKIATVSN